MHYLITGGAGFIGSHLCEVLLAAGHQLTILDDLSTGKRANVPAQAEIVVGDAADAQLLPELIAQVDGVFHLAAIASVQQSTQQWSASSRTNQFATIALLEAIAKREGGTIPFVYASSAAVYGDPAAEFLPLKETTPTVPLSPYGADKLGSELHARLARQLYGIPTLGLRFFNVFGERQDPSSPYSGVISIFMNRARAGQGVTIYGNGSQTRDFIYVKDVAARLMAAMALLESGEVPPPHALNIGRGEAVSIQALAELIARLNGRQPDITYEPERAGDIVHSCGDVSLSEQLLSCAAPVSLEAGLKQMMAYHSAS